MPRSVSMWAPAHHSSRIGRGRIRRRMREIIPLCVHVYLPVASRSGAIAFSILKLELVTGMLVTGHRPSWWIRKGIHEHQRGHVLA